MSTETEVIDVDEIEQPATNNNGSNSVDEIIDVDHDEVEEENPERATNATGTASTTNNGLNENEVIDVGDEVEETRDTAANNDNNEESIFNENDILQSVKKEAEEVLEECETTIDEIQYVLQEARELAGTAGLSIDSYIVNNPLIGVDTGDKNNTDNDGDETTSAAAIPVPTTTGGHSNTDHVVLLTGNTKIDRIAELKRNLMRRHKAMQPENRGDDRWDKPKRIPGERRRRIIREKDLEEAPPEPPLSGWQVFVGQMTVKFRHDEPDIPHDQAKVLQRIGNIWKNELSKEEREYYNQFATDARKEYQEQMIEYRATGYYQPTKQQFCPLEDTNIWICKDEQNNNDLEKEISSYETVKFPKRPPSMNEAYEERELRSILKRKLKDKGILLPDGTIKEGYDYDELLEQERVKRQKKKKQEEKQKQQSKRVATVVYENLKPSQVDSSDEKGSQDSDGSE